MMFHDSNYVNWPVVGEYKLPYFSEIPVKAIFKFEPKNFSPEYVKISDRKYTRVNEDFVYEIWYATEEKPLYWKATLV